MKNLGFIFLLLPSLVFCQNKIVGKWEITQFDMIIDGKNLEALEEGRSKLDTTYFYEFKTDNTFKAQAWLFPTVGALKPEEVTGTYRMNANVLTLDYKLSFERHPAKTIFNVEITDNILTLSYDKPMLLNAAKDGKSMADEMIGGLLKNFKTFQAFMKMSLL